MHVHYPDTELTEDIYAHKPKLWMWSNSHYSISHNAPLINMQDSTRFHQWI